MVRSGPVTRRQGESWARPSFGTVVSSFAALAALACATALLIVVAHRAPAAVSAAPAAQSGRRRGRARRPARRRPRRPVAALSRGRCGDGRRRAARPGRRGGRVAGPDRSPTCPRTGAAHLDRPRAARSEDRLARRGGGQTRRRAHLGRPPTACSSPASRTGSRTRTRDRLFLVDRRDGQDARLPRPAGAEPSAAPAVGQGRVREVHDSGGRHEDEGSAHPREPQGPEPDPRRARGARCGPTSTGSGRTTAPSPIRSSSPDGRWFLTGETGSDVRVTYAIRDAGGTPLLTLFTVALQAGAGWDATGTRTAFAGTVGRVRRVQRLRLGLRRGERLADALARGTAAPADDRLAWRGRRPASSRWAGSRPPALRRRGTCTCSPPPTSRP